MPVALDENQPPGQVVSGKAPAVTAWRRRAGAEVELLSKRLQLEERRRQEAELSLRDASAQARQFKDLVTSGAEKDKKIAELHARLNEAVVAWADAKLQLDEAQGPSEKLAHVDRDRKTLKDRLVAAESVALVLREDKEGLRNRLDLANEQILLLSERKGTGVGELNGLRREVEAAKSDCRVLEAKLAIQQEVAELQVTRLKHALVDKEHATQILLANNIDLGKRMLKLERKLEAQWDMEDALREELEKLGEVLAEKHDEELDSHFNLLNKLWRGEQPGSSSGSHSFCKEIVYGIAMDALDFAYRDVDRKRKEAQRLFLPARLRPPLH